MNKIIRHKISVLMLTSLIVVLLFIFFFWFDSIRQQHKQLIDFVPKGTWKYFEINFDNNNLNKLLQKDKTIKKALENFLIENDLPTNVWKGNYKIAKLALAQVETVINKKTYNGKVWLIYSSADIKALETLELKNYYLIFLTKNIIALTNSQPLAIEIKNNKNSYSLNSKKYYFTGMIGGYIKLENYLNKVKFNTIQQNIFNKYVTAKGNLSWQFNMNSAGEIIAEFNLPIEDNIKQLKVIMTDQQDITVINGTIIVKNFNGMIVVNLLEHIFKKQLSEDDQLFKTFLEKKYQVSIEGLYTFFKQPFSIVLMPKNNVLNLNNILNNQNYFYALVWQGDYQLVQPSDIINLEKLVQNYLAFKFPVIRKKILPDASSGFELVADPTEMIWQNKILLDGNIMHSLIFKNYEYAYLQSPDKFIVSNSQQLIKKVLQAPKREATNNFYKVFVSPTILNHFRMTDLSEIYLGGTIKNNNLKVTAKFLR